MFLRSLAWLEGNTLGKNRDWHYKGFVCLRFIFWGVFFFFLCGFFSWSQKGTEKTFTTILLNRAKAKYSSCYTWKLELVTQVWRSLSPQLGTTFTVFLFPKKSPFKVLTYCLTEALSTKVNQTLLLAKLSVPQRISELICMIWLFFLASSRILLTSMG